uniref:hypothetical protein n=1 Tax=Parasutterella excrementihominis TaxID=487175 RepID=UPI0025B01E1C
SVKGLSVKIGCDLYPTFRISNRKLETAAALASLVNNRKIPTRLQADESSLTKNLDTFFLAILMF